ncbi:hypothetical protein [Brucella anthropi]|uniref:hypothetical protein n=1 Tax=Brucella anthropi TaxID=529 RepID=UPI00244A46C6|nr:hypothetical protein [Brucella anthropi]MDG9790516.1 hypothetical protein [Brucella anthropi]MDH0580685.1 hypothetical protein [Brucella anthropi]MDH0817309.1 hypothetical protein [Brucella anthropi]MDH2084121.1 hypothetical protein [Brucella anthropi]
MAGYDFEFYETGKISVTAGQKAFTGSGTAWKLRGCEGALVVVVGAGTVNFVSSLSTDAAGEFRTEWTGPTLANASYVMWLPSAVAATALANHQRLAEIIASIHGAQPESDLLSAFAALVGAYGMVPMFTGPGTLDLADPATFGIQDPNGSLGKLAALTLAARQILQTDAAGSLKSVGLTPSRFLLTDANGDVSQPESIPFGVNLAGSNGNMDFAQIQQKNSFVMANNSVIWFTRSGLLLVNDISDGSVGLFVLGGNGGGSVTKLSGGFRFDTNLGTAGKVNVFFASNEYNHYEIQNLTGGPVTLRTIFIVTREAV